MKSNPVCAVRVKAKSKQRIRHALGLKIGFDLYVSETLLYMSWIL